MNAVVRECCLLRHAEARPPHGRQDDFDRVLSRRGEADAERLGAWLRAQDLGFEAVYCSPAVRTRSTLAAALPRHVLDAQLLPRLYLADVATLLGVLDAAPASGRVLLVGHNPGLEQLAQALCGWPVPHPLSTCGLLRLRRESGAGAVMLDAWQP